MKTLSDLKMATYIPTNSPFDELLDGGIQRGCITQFYGPPGSGKTNIALKLLYEATRDQKKAIYIDTEGGISLERLRQIAGSDFENIADKIYLLEPRGFDQQQILIRQLDATLDENEDIDMIVIDSMVALYRIEDGDPAEINKRLGHMMAELLKLSRKYEVAVVITNQIYSPFNSDDLIVQPIGGTVLKYWSKIIVEIEKDMITEQRSAVLKRHKTRPEGMSINFEITDNGIE